MNEWRVRGHFLWSWPKLGLHTWSKFLKNESHMENILTISSFGGFPWLSPIGNFLHFLHCPWLWWTLQVCFYKQQLKMGHIVNFSVLGVGTTRENYVGKKAVSSLPVSRSPHAHDGKRSSACPLGSGMGVPLCFQRTCTRGSCWCHAKRIQSLVTGHLDAFMGYF